MSAEMAAEFLFDPFFVIIVATLVDTIRLDQTMKPMAYENKSEHIKTE